MRVGRRLVQAASALAVALALLVVVDVVRLHLEMQQHLSTLDAWHLQKALLQYREREGEYPESILALAEEPQLPNWPEFAAGPRDAWGNLYYFERRGEAFLVLSPGRDARYERPDYWALRAIVPVHSSGASWHRSEYAVCGELSADIMVSDLGVHQGCFVK